MPDGRPADTEEPRVAVHMEAHTVTEPPVPEATVVLREETTVVVHIAEDRDRTEVGVRILTRLGSKISFISGSVEPEDRTGRWRSRETGWNSVVSLSLFMPEIIGMQEMN